MPDFMRIYLPRHRQPGHSQPQQGMPWIRQVAAYGVMALLLPGGSVIALITLAISVYRRLHLKTGGLS